MGSNSKPSTTSSSKSNPMTTSHSKSKSKQSPETTVTSNSKPASSSKPSQSDTELDDVASAGQVSAWVRAFVMIQLSSADFVSPSDSCVYV